MLSCLSVLFVGRQSSRKYLQTDSVCDEFHFSDEQNNKMKSKKIWENFMHE